MYHNFAPKSVVKVHKGVFGARSLMRAAPGAFIIALCSEPGIERPSLPADMVGWGTVFWRCVQPEHGRWLCWRNGPCRQCDLINFCVQGLISPHAR